MPSLYNEYYALTPEGEGLADRIYREVQESTRLLMRRGFSPREIESVIVDQVVTTIAIEVLHYAVAKRKAERKESHDSH